MKHWKFTVQFFVLLLAIPALMYAEFTRDTKKTVEKKQQTVEKDCTKAANADYFLPTNHSFLN